MAMASPDSGCDKVPRVAPGASDISADALAQPTRARVFRRVALHGGPIGTKELAAELGLHPSGVRVHLEQLHQAGLVSRHLIAQARGRPRYGWQVAVDAEPGGQPPDAYRLLAGWLARSIPARPVRLREVERAGRELGRELGHVPGHAPADETMGRSLTALGFAPRRKRAKTGQVTFRLGSCPYRDAVGENQEVVCALHRGLTEGLLDALAPSARLSQFVPKEPERAGCLIEVEGFDPT